MTISRLSASVLSIASAYLICVVPAQPVQAQTFRTVDDGPIHEAYLPAVTGVVALDAIAQEPPRPITERIPPKCDPDAEWISGYWLFDGDLDDFNWMSGCWRKRPPGRQWIDGFWKEYDAGWVWIRGFWGKVAAEDLTYIDEPPPDQFDEDPPPSPGRGYFWVSGYWDWSPGRGYEKRTGHWEEMDEKWLLVPAHYVFRPNGYVLVSAYWDWPIENRGCSYKCVYIEPAARVVEVIYEPTVIVEPAYVVGWCYSYYPDYVYFLHHHYHHHYGWWHDHYDVPTWWGWHGWWAHSWHDHWGLWWWYCHPGYPHPVFLSATLAASIHPPSEKFILATKKHKAPPIVTATGVVSPSKTMAMAVKSKGKDTDDGTGKKSKLAPVTVTKLKDDDKKGDKKVSGVDKSFILPSGTKTAKDVDDDPKKHPPKPKTSELVTSPGGKVAPPFTTGTGKTKGKDDGKGTGVTPPITIKSKSPDSPAGDTKGKGDKPKGKMEDKPGGDKPKPPFVPSGSDKPKDKDKDKPGDVSPSKKPGSPAPPPPPDPKPKDKPPKGSDDKPGAGKPSGTPAPPTAPAPGDSKPKDKDKDKDKKKDKS